MRRHWTFWGKWTFLIIRDLFDGTKRFGELRKSLSGVSPKTLSARLKKLERKDIITRNTYATIPPTVEYTLTEKGYSLKSIIKEMKMWGAKSIGFDTVLATTSM